MTLEAGRELDAQVAEKVMGLKPCTDPVGRCEAAHMTPPMCWGDGAGGSDLEPYSTNIAAAWLVIERLTSQGWSVELSVTDDPPNVDVEIRDRPSGHQRAAEYAASAPLAICRAALLAVIRPHCWCDD